jgi:hypothetical protein
MASLPPRADIDQLRRIAKDRLRAARDGDTDLRRWLAEAGPDVTLANAQCRLAREYGFRSWPELVLEVARRRVLDLHDAAALAAFIADHPDDSLDDMHQWSDHPLGASPLGYVAMARFDTTTGTWRDVPGAAASAHVLIATGAPVDGREGDPETPLITAASYGDADVAAVLIAAGADLDAVASDRGGGVPGGSALLHAAVFGMTDVVDVLVAAGARIRSIEEAAAAGDIGSWLDDDTPTESRLRALIMAADHQRLAVIDELVAAGTPVDREDDVFHRHPLRVAAANGRPDSVAALLAHGADSTAPDDSGRTPLDHCRAGRSSATAPDGHDAVETVLLAAITNR